MQTSPCNAQFCRFAAKTARTGISINAAFFRTGDAAFVFAAAKILYHGISMYQSLWRSTITLIMV